MSWALLKLLFPDGRSKALSDPNANPTRPAPRSRAIQAPDEQMACFDYLYYTCAHEPLEFKRDFSPMWRDVLAHAHWTPALAAHGTAVLRRTFGLPAARGEIPPFIALHARHGDFAMYCSDVSPACFASLDAFARRVVEVQDALEAWTGVRPTRVVMTADESDEAWWEDVAARGWYRLCHHGEAKELGSEEYGNWYPVLMDAVVQSMAIGFVGTEESTFSHIARRRVVDWNRGVARMVKWGRQGADDH